MRRYVSASTDWNLGGHMPKREARNPTSAKGDWFIDDRCINCAPSPTEEATRLTDPARTSPTANTPGCEVPNGDVTNSAPRPVITNPLSSSSTKPESHSVFGAAP